MGGNWKISWGIAILLSTSCLFADAHAQNDVVTTELHPRIAAFFRNLADRSGAQRAFKELLARSPLDGTENVKAMIDQVDRFEDKYGAFLEIERVHSKFVGKDLVLLTYLYKAEKFPVVWYFTFYRPPRPATDDNAWSVISVRFDSNLRMLRLQPPDPAPRTLN